MKIYVEVGMMTWAVKNLVLARFCVRHSSYETHNFITSLRSRGDMWRKLRTNEQWAILFISSFPSENTDHISSPPKCPHSTRGVCLTSLLGIVFYEQNSERVEKLENSEASLISIGKGRETQQAGEKKIDCHKGECMYKIFWQISLSFSLYMCIYVYWGGICIYWGGNSCHFKK